MKSATRQIRNEHQRAFVKLFDGLCNRHSRWTIWADFVVMSAIEISNAVDQLNVPHRAQTYATLASKYNEVERNTFAQMLAEVTMGMEQSADQDFLGELFMALELSNDHNGQFFTPYSVCRMMAMMQTDVKDRVQQYGWTSVNDCACGAGALLIAFANECLRQGINYQTSVLFVAQDIDYVVSCMCYLQLSLLGCPGYVVIADTLRSPAVSHDRRGLIPCYGENVWYTPLYFSNTWHYRRLWAHIDALCNPSLAASQDQAEKPTSKPLGTGSQPPIETRHGQLTLF